MAYTFIRNTYILLLPKHFKTLCSAINMLFADLNCEISGQSELQFSDQQLASSYSGLSQRLAHYSLANGRVILGRQPSTLITADTAIRTDSSTPTQKKNNKLYITFNARPGFISCDWLIGLLGIASHQVLCPHVRSQQLQTPV